MSQGKVIVTGTTGNDVVHIAQIRDNLRSIDANGKPIRAGKGCTQQSATVVACRSSRVYASLGDGNDSVIVDGKGRMQFDGGAGNDVFRGGPSQDVFIGGLGNDAVDYRNRADGSVAFEIGGGPVSGARGERDDIRGDIESVLMP
jgi:Ca2+-binding RTX toxin-like protein